LRGVIDNIRFGGLMDIVDVFSSVDCHLSRGGFLFLLYSTCHTLKVCQTWIVKSPQLSGLFCGCWFY